MQLYKANLNANFLKDVYLRRKSTILQLDKITFVVRKGAKMLGGLTGKTGVGAEQLFSHGPCCWGNAEAKPGGTVEGRTNDGQSNDIGRNKCQFAFHYIRFTIPIFKKISWFFRFLTVLCTACRRKTLVVWPNLLSPPSSSPSHLCRDKCSPQPALQPCRHDPRSGRLLKYAEMTIINNQMKGENVYFLKCYCFLIKKC